MSAKRAVSTFDGRVYTHRILFAMAERALERAEADPREFDARLTASVLAAFAVEAYVNLVVGHLDPAALANERAYFRGQYAGLRGKIRWALAQLNAKPPPTIETCRRRVVTLLKLRDELAHAKPIDFAGSTVHSTETEPPWMEPHWIESRTELPKVRRYVNAVRRFCEWLNTKARSRIGDPYLNHGAFGGVLQAQLGSSTVLSPKTRPKRRTASRRKPLP